MSLAASQDKWVAGRWSWDYLYCQPWVGTWPDGLH